MTDLLTALSTLVMAPMTSKLASSGDTDGETLGGVQVPFEGICWSSTGLGSPISQSASFTIAGRPSSSDKSPYVGQYSFIKLFKPHTCHMYRYSTRHAYAFHLQPMANFWHHSASRDLGPYEQRSLGIPSRQIFGSSRSR